MSQKTAANRRCSARFGVRAVIKFTLLLFALSFTAFAARALTPEQTQCMSNEPAVAVRGCTAMLGDPRESENNLRIAHMKRARAYGLQNQFHEAIADYGQVIALDPNYAMPYNNRADAWLQLGDYAQAVTDFTRAIQIKPDFALSYAGRAQARLSSGMASEAVPDVEEALRLDPQNPVILRLKAAVDARLQRRTVAAVAPPAAPVQAAPMPVKKSGSDDWFALFFLACALSMMVAFILLIALAVLFSFFPETATDPTPDDMPYEIPFSYAHPKGQGTRIPWALLVLMNLCFLAAGLLLFGDTANPNSRHMIQDGPFLAAVGVWDALLLLYVYLATNFTASLTVDAQGIKRTRWSKSNAWSWKDIADARIGPLPQNQKMLILQILVPGQAPDTGGWISGFSYVGVKRYRLLETIRRGLQRWGSPAAKQAVAAPLEQEKHIRNDGTGAADAEINSEAKRNVQAQKKLRWVGLAIILALLVGVQLGFAQGVFIPAAMTLSWGFAGVGLLVVAVLFYLVRGSGKNTPRDAKSIGVILLGVGVALIFCLQWGSQELLIALPDTYTRLAGAAAVRHVTALGWHPESRGRHSHTCAGVDIADLPSLLGRLCLDRQVTPGTDLILHGRQSILGFHVDSIER